MRNRKEIFYIYNMFCILLHILHIFNILHILHILCILHTLRILHVLYILHSLHNLHVQHILHIQRHQRSLSPHVVLLKRRWCWTQSRSTLSRTFLRPSWHLDCCLSWRTIALGILLHVDTALWVYPHQSPQSPIFSSEIRSKIWVNSCISEKKSEFGA